MRNRVIGLAGAVVLALLLVGCAQPQPEIPQTVAEPQSPPDVYRVRFETTKGDFVIEVRREWAPRGADQFHYLVQNRFYDGATFFRVVRGFVAQFGINSDPKIQGLYGQMQIRDDSVRESNTRGFVSFAKLGPDSRATQVFINLDDNTNLDKDGFVPFGQVIEGMDNVDRLWNSYGELAPRGSGPDPTRIEREGDAYLSREFPRLDSIVRASLIPAENPK